jgi:hypothetical protein
MAQRLETEYVKACLKLTEAEMQQFLRWFADQQVTTLVRVLDNGSHEVVMTDGSGEEVTLSFERRKDRYVCTGSCRLLNPQMANTMRKAVAKFKGDAIVKRIYSHYTMMYFYEKGSVVKIVEIKQGSHNVIYEYKNTAAQLEQLYLKQETEQEIAMIHRQINQLLDLRNGSTEAEVVHHIDERLAKLTRRLFVLEA